VSQAEGAATFRAPAETYNRHVGRYAPALSAALMEVAGVEQGMRVLDIGCGPGGLTSALADLVGAENVAAVDPSEPFAEACRARVRGADVRVGAAEKLPFRDDEFDSVLSQLVVNFMSDAELGIREKRRVARAGGVVAACVWDYAQGMTMLRAFWDAAIDVEPGEGSEKDEGRTMRYCSPGELRDLWLGASLADVRVGELVVSAEYEDFDDLWTPFPTGIAPSGAFCASLDSERQEALRLAYRHRLGDPNGPFSLDARAWFAVGRV